MTSTSATQTATVRLLRSVSVFAQSPDPVLAELAGLIERLDVPAGGVICSQGDLGDCLYIVADGRVRVHDGERTFTFLSRSDVFGEMAVLDPEPRSASVTATEPTHLLLLRREPFYRLVAGRSEVARGIIQILAQRLRLRTRDLVEDYQYIQQFNRVIAAATAVEAGVYEPELLDEVANRTDALGQLARVFQKMAREVYVREVQLKRQVDELRIEIDLAKQARQVREITETEYFQQLRERARTLRAHSDKQ
jgi:CRP/FNR family cyclic AMP-dependent transcriptional regulator